MSKTRINREDLETAAKMAGEEIPPPQQTEEKEKPLFIPKSLVIHEGTIYEQVVLGHKVQYAAYEFNTKKLYYTNNIDISTKKKKKYYVPIKDDAIEKEQIFLPSAAEQYGTQEQLLQDIQDFINKYLDVPPEHVKMCAWSTLKSWAYDLFDSVNYLRCLGDYGTGKSRYTKTLGHIYYKCALATGATSSAALFRHMDKWRGSVAIDEADRKAGEETEEITKIINQGFEKGFPVWRCHPKNYTNEYHEVYCPKILSSRKPFADKATESRCFSTTMKRTTRKEIPPELNAEFKQEALRLRNKLLMWRFENYKKIDVNIGASFDFGNIEPRLRQIAVGFVPLFTHNEPLLQEFKQYIQGRQQEFIEIRSGTWEGLTVRAVAELIIEKKDNLITATEIIERADLRDNKTGELVKPRSLSKYAQSLGFGKPVPRRNKDTGKTWKPYEIDLVSLKQLLPLYVLDAEELVTKLPSLPSLPNAPEEEQKPLTPSISLIPPVSNNGNNGNTVTVKEALIRLEKELNAPVCFQNIALAEELKGYTEEGILDALEHLQQKGDVYKPSNDTWSVLK